jgi:MAF protein
VPGPRILLASASPRRRELLATLGADFEVVAADVDESTDEVDPVRMAEGLALRKARAVAAAHRGAADGIAILAADTIVVDGWRVLGKPADADDARATLAALCGREHEVVTGVAVVAGERVAADFARTTVRMRDYTEEEIAAYIARGEPFDKAGSYAIQDEAFHPVATTEGCVCSVVGLPLWTVRRLLRAAAGIDIAEPRLERCAVCPLRDSATTR